MLGISVMQSRTGHTWTTAPYSVWSECHVPIVLCCNYSWNVVFEKVHQMWQVPPLVFKYSFAVVDCYKTKSTFGLFQLINWIECKAFQLYSICMIVGKINNWFKCSCDLYTCVYISMRTHTNEFVFMDGQIVDIGAQRFHYPISTILVRRQLQW